MKIYISGNRIGLMTNTIEIRDKFTHVANIIKKCGHEVVNPVDDDHCEARGQYRHYGIDNTNIGSLHLLYDLSLVASCNAIFLLPDWKESPDARAELAYAQAIGKKIIAVQVLDPRQWPNPSSNFDKILSDFIKMEKQ